jgi:hypothetical protein
MATAIAEKICRFCTAELGLNNVLCQHGVSPGVCDVHLMNKLMDTSIPLDVLKWILKERHEYDRMRVRVPYLKLNPQLVDEYQQSVSGGHVVI